MEPERWNRIERKLSRRPGPCTGKAGRHFWLKSAQNQTCGAKSNRCWDSTDLATRCWSTRRGQKAFARETLGPYRIVSFIAAGGMGQVYRARDPRMGRDIAIKVAAERFSERFSREVHAVASLNHPNICHLYDVGPNYLVMELIEGESPQGPLPLEEALRIARQIADALEAAHEKGIVHRDLKPANIKVRPDGTVKVLDFGLAKSAEPAELTSDSPTMLSAAGMILGTAAYMSPEQARGKVVDKRADIWAFGVVLYEMLTGKRPFEGETTTEILSEVIKTEPTWNGIPPQVQRLLKSCLEKDPKKRLRDIGDAWDLLEEGSPAESPRHSKLALSAVRGSLAVVLALVPSALALVHFRGEPLSVAEFLSHICISAASNREISGWFDPAGGVPRWPQARVPGNGALMGNCNYGSDRSILFRRGSCPASNPDSVHTPEPFFWSSDSRFIAFLSSDHKLKKVNASGGPAQTLCDASGLISGSWSRGRSHPVW